MHKPSKVLTYPKSLASKKQVLHEIGYFKYAKAWKYSHDKKNHYLSLYPHLIFKHYPDFRTREYKPRLRERKPKSVIDFIKLPRYI